MKPPIEKSAIRRRAPWRTAAVTTAGMRDAAPSLRDPVGAIMASDMLPNQAA